MTKKGKKQEEQGTNRFIRSIRLRNILSFGPDSDEIELEPLNVLIGPNASGKSNLIEAISLLKAAPVDVFGPIRDGGGLQSWLWKGAEIPDPPRIEMTVDYLSGTSSLRYALELTKYTDRGLQIKDESVDEGEARPQPQPDRADSFYWRWGDEARIRIRTNDKSQLGSAAGREEKVMRAFELSQQQSILAQRRDPDLYPEITYLGEQFKKIRLFREWRLGPGGPVRMPQRTDLPGDFLLEDASNLAMVINRLELNKILKESVSKHLNAFCDHMVRVTTTMDFGTARIYVEEWDGRMIPATRLSDGTLHYLCLLVILCHPEPPPLICLEEPELGLHPDMIGSVAELLVEASKRTQLIVTTHSEILVSALSETPESILVCEQDAGGTRMRRLEKKRLRKWLQRYSLGDLWRKGVVGGNRW